jgi:hypothetical protein
MSENIWASSIFLDHFTDKAERLDRRLFSQPKTSAMKAKIVVILSFLFALLYTPVSAQTASELVTSITDSEKPAAVLVQLSNLDGEWTEIHLTNSKGFTAYRKSIRNQNSYGAHFLMEGMPHDDYLIRVSNNEDHYLKAFFFNDEGICLLGPDRVPGDGIRKLIARFTPVEGAPKLETQIANVDGRPFSLYLVKLDGVKFFTKEMKGKPGFAQCFNFEGMDEGDYYIFVRAGDSVVWQNFAYRKGEILLKQKFNSGDVEEGGPVLPAVALQ